MSGRVLSAIAAEPGAPVAYPPIDLRPLFAPRSIAVIGASPRSSIAPVVRDNLRLLGSDTHCYFVNPRYGELWDSRCYPSLGALPEVPETVLIALNPLRAAPFAREAAEAGARALIIPGGGVVEGGEAAARMQAEVRAIALEHGIALLGPNCMGVIDYTTNVAAYIGDISPYLPRGHVAGIAQSGSVADAFIHSGTRIGFSRIVSCGAEVVLDVTDFLAHCLDDPETHAIILFVEGFKRPERFLALADRALELGKPILAVKVGRSPQAQAAAVAHSGSLAGEDRVTDAALRAAGVVRFDDLDALLEAAELFAGCDRLGRFAGRGRTGVVTVSTGEASLIADLAPRLGLDLPPVPEEARDRLLRELPTLGYIGNPLDPWGATDADTAYRACLEAFADSGAFDVLAVVHDFPYASLPNETEVAGGVAHAMVEATRGRPDLLPVYVSLTSGEPPAELKELLDAEGGIPILRGTSEAFGAIARRAWWEARRDRRLAEGPARSTWPDLARDRLPFGHDRAARGAADRAVGEAVGERRRILSERESLELLHAAGLLVTDAIAAAGLSDADIALEAVAAADRLGYPVALKLDASGLPHKSDIGGVRLGVADGPSVEAAVPQLLAAGRAAGAAVRGILVEPMAPPGVELIVGLTRDPLMGPAVMVGLGGILAEVIGDVAIRLAPVTRHDALEMLDELRGAAVLRGARGASPVDREAIADLVVRLGRLGWERPDIVAVDLNPVVAGAWGALAVDALAILSSDPAHPADPSDPAAESPGDQS